MTNDLTDGDVRELLEGVAGDRVRSSGPPVVVDWNGLLVRAVARGTNIGKLALVLATDVAPYVDVVDRVPVAKLLEHTASNASVRMVVQGQTIALESAVVWDEVDPARRGDVLRWRLAELFSVASAWRALLGLDPPGAADARGAETLASLKRSVRLVPEHALMVASAAFGVAGADGQISPAERDKLRGWLADVPAFAAIDPTRVVRAIAALATDPARALFEAARRLDRRARLLAWALANDMAHADGFASDEERRYLAEMAMVFKLDASDLAVLVADAQERAVKRETIEPPPPAAPDVVRAQAS